MAAEEPKLAAATAGFDPATFSLASDVLDATFVTRCPLDIARHTMLVGVCTIPCGREGTDDMGWHVADFLAFKSLFDPYISSRNQAWLSHTDVVSAANKHGYTHSGRRLGNNIQSRDVPIVVEPSASKLAAKIISQIFCKAQMAKENGEPLTIIVCGPTTLEQDICLVDDEYKVSVTSEQISAIIDNDVNVTFVTPSMTSAGWQVNPSFMSKPDTSSGTLHSAPASPIDFLARQCGAIFGSRIVPYMLDWDSPLIQHLVDSSEFPVVMTREQQQARANLQMGIHSVLAGRMINDHGNHTFSFETDMDQWEVLFGPRKGRSLEELSQHWGKLPEANLANTTETSEPSTGISHGDVPKKFNFLGGAFGGNKASQISHMKHLIKESLNSWPGYYSTSFGQLLRRELDGYLDQTPHDDFEWHAMFNIMENRMSLMVLGDLVTKNFGLTPVFNARCRDWDEGKWSSLITTPERNLASHLFGSIHRRLSPICLPPGQNINLMRKSHMLVARASQYIAAALTMRFRQESPLLDAAVNDVVSLFQKIQARQIELIMENHDVRALGAAWLDSIGIPVKKDPAKTGSVKHDMARVADQYAPKQPRHAAGSASIVIQRPPTNMKAASLSKPSVSCDGHNSPVPRVMVQRSSPVKAEIDRREPQRYGDKGAMSNVTRRDIEAGATVLSLQTKASIKQSPTIPMGGNIKISTKNLLPTKPLVSNGSPNQDGMKEEPKPDPEGHLLPHLRKNFILKPSSKNIQEESNATPMKLGSAQYNIKDQLGSSQPEEPEPDPEAHLLPHLRKVFRPQVNEQPRGT